MLSNIPENILSFYKHAMTSCLIWNENRIFKQVVKNNFCIAKQIYNVFSLSLITLKVLTKKITHRSRLRSGLSKSLNSIFFGFLIASWYRLIETTNAGQDCQDFPDFWDFLRFVDSFSHESRPTFAKTKVNTV